jgi:hypothetical protein
VIPIGLYAEHEPEILKRPAGFVDDITMTKGFSFLRDDPEARLIVNCENSFTTRAYHTLTYFSPWSMVNGFSLTSYEFVS